MATTSPPPQPASSCERFDRLVRVLQKALAKSHSQVEIDSLIKQVYGDDASIFKDDQLHTVLESLLESLDEDVEKDMMKFMGDEDVERKLLIVERLIKNLEREDAARKQVLQDDKETTLKAMERAKLPDGLKPLDLANYQRYQRLLQEKKTLQEDIAAMERDIQGLDENKANRQAQVVAASEKVHEVGSVLEKAANARSG
jgi:hypothetical protein